jgi:hypothetical protein
MTNFECDKIIILHYEIGSGGRFLANSLGLSDKCTFTNSKLSEMQLNGKFDSIKKIKYLNRALENTDKKWRDLYLLDKDWTGIDYDIHFHFDENQLREFKYNNIFSKLTEVNEKILFLNTHSNHELSILLKVWKNAKVISFKNTKLFLLVRRFKSDYNLFVKIWNLISNKNLPDVPYSKEQFYNMDQKVLKVVSDNLKDKNFIETLKKELSGDLNKNVPKSFNEYKKLSREKKYILKKEYNNNDFLVKDSFFVWDVNWYFEEDECIEKLKILYDKLSLNDYNESYLRMYYNSWITKLDNIN